MSVCGCAIAQVVNHWFYIMEAQVWTLGIPYEICGWEKWPWDRFFSKYFCCVESVIILPVVHIHSWIITWGSHNRPSSNCSTKGLPHPSPRRKNSCQLCAGISL